MADDIAWEDVPEEIAWEDVDETPAEVKVENFPGSPDSVIAREAMLKMRRGEPLDVESQGILSRYLQASKVNRNTPREALNYTLDRASLGAMSGTLGKYVLPKMLGQQASDQFRTDVHNFEREVPWYKRVPLDMLGAAPMMATPNSLLVNAGLGALQGGIGTRSEDLEGVTRDIGAGQIFGILGHGLSRGLGFAAGKALRPTRSVGEAMQVPQKVVDETAYRLGGTKVGKFLGENADDITRDPLRSARVRSAQGAIAKQKAFTPEVIDQIDQIDPSKLSPDDRAAYRLALEEMAGRADVGPEGWALRSSQGIDELAEIQSNEIGRAGANVYPDVPAGMNMFDVSNERLAMSQQPRPTVQEPFPWKRTPTIADRDKPGWWARKWEPGRMNGKYADRLRQEIRQAEPGWSDSRIEAEVDAIVYPSGNWERAKMRNDIQGPSPAEALDPSKRLDPAEEAYRHGAFRRGAKAGIDDAERYTMDTASQMAANMRQNAAKEAEQKAWQAALDEGAARATDEIQRIQAGRSAISTAAGALEGSTTTFGVLGAGIGAMVGKRIGSPTMKAVDLAGAAGQRVADVASKIDQWALRNDALGRAAKWALEGGVSGGTSQAVRLMVLSQLPEAQDELGTE